MPPPDYIDCLLRITSHSQATLEFQGASYSGKPKLDPAALKEFLLKNETDPERYGLELFKSLFQPGDDLTSGYRLALSLSDWSHRRVRLHLQIDSGAPADLFAINWERLYDDKVKQTLSRWRQTAFSRFTGLDKRVTEPFKGSPKLLVVISTPSDYASTNLDRIDRAKVTEELITALQPLTSLVRCEFLDTPATRSNIRKRLQQDGFQAVHIQAHGLVPPESEMAWMMLEKENGEADPINENSFREIFGSLEDIRLVVLMACQSGTSTRSDPFGGLAQTLVQENLPFVIAMQRPIAFAAAKVFNQHFYSELASHGQIDVAVNEARLQLSLSFPEEPKNSSVPVLFMRSTESRAWTAAARVEVREPEVPVVTEESEFWKSILEALNEDFLIPILGPGINHGLLP